MQKKTLVELLQDLEMCAKQRSAAAGSGEWVWWEGCCECGFAAAAAGGGGVWAVFFYAASSGDVKCNPRFLRDCVEMCEV